MNFYYNLPRIIIFFFVTPVVLRTSSYPCVQDPLLVGLGEVHGMPGAHPGLACKRQVHYRCTIALALAWNLTLLENLLFEII